MARYNDDGDFEEGAYPTSSLLAAALYTTYDHNAAAAWTWD